MFKIVNGTRQGAIASPDLWSVYLDPLLKDLRRLGVGCHVGNLFIGVVAYADDLLLLAPNREAAQQMLALCEAWAKANNVQFSTDQDPKKSKSKVIFMCGHKTNVTRPVPLSLCGKELPYVQTATHLGHELHESGTMEYDTRVKRAKFISNCLDIRETFKFASPVEILKAMKLYNCSFYGSNLWDLDSSSAKQIYSAWDTNVKLTWSVPRATRSYLVEQVLSSGYTSARVDILAKFAGFFKSLRLSPSPEVSFLTFLVGRDLRTVTGRNLRY